MQQSFPRNRKASAYGPLPGGGHVVEGLRVVLEDLVEERVQEAEAGLAAPNPQVVQQGEHAGSGGRGAARPRDAWQRDAVRDDGEALGLGRDVWKAAARGVEIRCGW